MHDIADLEARSIPTVMVASSAFEEAAGVQARALGVEPVTVFVPHPIQDRTDEEMKEIADNAVDGILSALTS